MNGKEMTDLLAALKITGWPEWQQTGPVPQAKGLWLLVCYIPARWVIARSHQDQVHAWCDSVSIDEPVALALCEHHLWAWLAARGAFYAFSDGDDYYRLEGTPASRYVMGAGKSWLAALVAAVLAVGKEKP